MNFFFQYSFQLLYKHLPCQVLNCSKMLHTISRKQRNIEMEFLRSCSQSVPTIKKHERNLKISIKQRKRAVRRNEKFLEVRTILLRIKNKMHCIFQRKMGCRVKYSFKVKNEKNNTPLPHSVRGTYNLGHRTQYARRGHPYPGGSNHK